LGFIGLSGGGGGFAGSVVVPEENVVEVPEAVPIKHAALTEPFAVGLRAVRSSAMRAGDSIAIIGAGPIGLTIVQAAAVGGGCDIFVSEPQYQRRELAMSAGATHVFDPTKSDLPSEVSTRTDGGVDVVFEVSGVEQGFIDAINVCKHGGEVTLVALHETPVKFNPTDIVIVDKHIRGTNVYAGGNQSEHDFGIVLNLFEKNHFDPELLISDNVPLGQLTRVFETYKERSPVKIIVEP
jgi:(R,R)-butanediol dehydrogenase/meso-butanediol dehydrogenase/diacetyl reductase